MYNGIKSCISINTNTSEFFACARRVRQGENLSPLLFSLFLNDVEHYLTSRNNSGVDVSDDTLGIYLRLVVILYADDTVLFANDDAELLTVVHTFNDYWKLHINFDKTKILVFGDKFRRKRDFNIEGKDIEVVDVFKYLGSHVLKKQTIFIRKGTYKGCMKKLEI